MKNVCDSLLQMAASMELRAKMVPITVKSSECTTGKKHVDVKHLHSDADETSETTGLHSSDEVKESPLEGNKSPRIDKRDDIESGTPSSPTTAKEYVPASISVAMISKLTQVLMICANKKILSHLLGLLSSLVSASYVGARNGRCIAPVLQCRCRSFCC